MLKYYVNIGVLKLRKTRKNLKGVQKVLVRIDDFVFEPVTYSTDLLKPGGDDTYHQV